MGPEVIAYPFIFLALYFESFLLVTFFSAPARAKRVLSPALEATEAPKVAIVVPCWNEESTVTGTVESLLALDYPADQLSIVLVNDGSTDGTGAAIDHYASHPQVTAIHKQNGGKFTAMNYGLEHINDAEFIGFLDADSFVAPDALREIIPAFDGPEVAAVTASMSIHKPKTIFQRIQYAEYAQAITLRHVFGSINGLYVTPGPFSFYRRSVLATLGPFRHAYLAEDMEMAMRIQRAGYKIGNALRARVYTKGPPTMRKLIKQRIRWTTGFMRNLFFDYRDLIWSKQNVVLGFFVLPLGIAAIGGAILLFLLYLFQTGQSLIHSLLVMQAAPLSYAFSVHPLSWFYLPVTLPLLLGATMTVLTISWMAVGKRASNTPGRLIPNLPLYFLFYSFVAPIWIIRSVSHVVRGARTTWR